jgi:hypothetical protein
MQRGKSLQGAILAIALGCAHGAAGAVDIVVDNDSRYTSEAGFLPAVTEARDAAAVFAIAGAMQVNVMAKHCAALGPMQAIRANEARNVWWRHNDSTVQAANAYVRLQRAIVHVKQGEAAGNAYRDNVNAGAKAGARATLDGWFPNESRDVATCEKVVDEYLAGKHDVGADPRFAATLGKLEGDMQAYADAQRVQ